MGCCCCAQEEEHPSIVFNSGVDSSPRECTDLLPLFVFIVFCLGLVAVGGVAVIKGDPYRIINGVDSFGNTCGRRNAALVGSVNDSVERDFLPLSGKDMTSKRYLFPLDLSHPFSSAWICVRKCPSKTISVDDLAVFNMETNFSFCSDAFTFDGVSQHRYCPLGTVYKSDGAFLSRCVPNDFVDMAIDLVASLTNYVREKDWIRGFVKDLYSARFDIAAFCIASVGASLSMVFLVRFLAPVIVYFIYVSIVLIAVGLAGALWYWWYSLRKAYEAHMTVLSSEPIVSLPGVDQRTAMVLAILVSIVAVLLVFGVWCMWPRGALIVDLFRESGRSLAAVPFLLFQPLLTCFITLVFIVAWLTVAVYIYTSMPAVPMPITRANGEVVNETVAFRMTDRVRYMWYYHLVGLVWVTEFIFACHRMVVAGAVATLYFNRKGISSPWCFSLKNLLCFHLGSVALGSFIITLVKLPRYIFMYFYAKLKASDSIVATRVLQCAIVCLACVERFLRYLHHNAYTVIAINGQSFCPAARMAVDVLLDNAVNVATVNTIGDFVLFLAQCIVAALSFAAATYRFKYQMGLEYGVYCALLVGLCAYFIASCFMSIVEMVIDTLFLCFAEDHDIVSRSSGAADYFDAHFKDYMTSTVDRERDLNRSRNRYLTPKNNRMIAEQVPLSVITTA